MLKNYIKIAWKVLLRRKFFTFISLFGISFTLMVLMVATSLIYHAVGPQYPELKSDRMLYSDRLIMKGKSGMSSSYLSYYFINKYIKPLETPERISFFTSSMSFTEYHQNRKIELVTRYTDSNFWRILDFDFIEGGPYGQAAVDGAAKVAVISEVMQQTYFGTEKAIGKLIQIDKDNFKVIGVVKTVPSFRRNVYANVWVPYTTLKSYGSAPQFTGIFNVILLAKSAGETRQVQAELEEMRKNIQFLPKDAKLYDTVQIYADTPSESFLRWFTQQEGQINHLEFYGWIIGGMLVFMLLPAINLININISRIMERASEIGVRKAFGASSKVLVVQFLVENIFLTVLGGLLGTVLSILILEAINSSGFFAYADLSLNVPVCVYSLLLCLFFGLISGVYPAYRMSKLPAVAALKGGVQ